MQVFRLHLVKSGQYVGVSRRMDGLTLTTLPIVSKIVSMDSVPIMVRPCCGQSMPLLRKVRSKGNRFAISLLGNNRSKVFPVSNSLMRSLYCLRMSSISTLVSMRTLAEENCNFEMKSRCVPRKKSPGTIAHIATMHIHSTQQSHRMCVAPLIVTLLIYY